MSVIWAIYKTAIKETSAYRFSMMLSIVTGPLFLGVTILIWKALYGSNDLLAGFSFDQLVLYFLLTIVTGYLLWDDATDILKDLIADGKLSVFLLKPVTFLWYEFWKKVGDRSVAFVIEFVPVTFIVGFMVGFDLLKEVHVLYYTGAVLIAFIMSFLINFLLGMLAFWFTKPNGLIWIYRSVSGFLTGLMLPLSFYPPVAQKLFFILPFQFLGFVPAQLAQGRYELGGIMLNPLIVLVYGALQVIVLVLIAALLWKIALRRFSGVGV